MSEQDELLREFLIESYENLDRLDGEFVALEEDPESEETLSSIFRTIHTIKGTCGFLQLSRLESVTHAGENLLSSLREGETALTDEITTTLLHLVDAVREMLAHIEETGEEGAEEYAELVATLKSLQATATGSEPQPAQADTTEQEEAEGVDTEDESSSDDPEGDSEQRDGAEKASDEPAADAKSDKPGAKAESTEGREPRSSSISGSNIRVQVEQLDKLMNLAGELVLARNQILQAATASHDASAIAVAQGLNLITTELQERIMKVRMQEVGMMWGKLPRVVRDLSKQLGKKVRLEMRGKGTELDKTLLEAIQDPITHLVRNAVDHGIESPEERLAAGKEGEGTLLLDAYHESGQVHIEIVDDGKGIDPEAIKAKALSQQIITADQAAEMSDTQAYSLIFHAGLSTAKAVTNVSGRGVGMDVVRTNIERIGGIVEVKSSLGKGTTVRIQIPLTLAIIPALIITTAGDRYAIPQVSLVELVRLDGEAARTGIEDLHGSPVYRLRGELLPLLFLNEQLSVEASAEGDEAGEEPCRNIVVLRAADQLFGLVVDDINDTEEIVVKPLDQQTKSVPVYAGTTILGDGQVALILDIQGLARRSGVLADDGPAHHVDDEEAGAARPTRSYIMLRTGGRRMAVELSDVDRLEEFQVSDIEHSCGHEVVQYRGEIMPLVRVADALGVPRSSEEGDEEVVRVVVHCRDGQSVGLAVEGITDIIETSDAVKRPSGMPGILEAVVIDGRVTDLLDLDNLVSSIAISQEGDSANEQDADESDADLGVRQFCTFYLGDLYFGVDVMKVQEVLRHQPMTRVPLTTEVVSGLINLRGQTVTALDMRTRLGLPSFDAQAVGQDEEPTSMNIVLRTGSEVVSILVDRIGDVLSVEESSRAPVPNTVKPEVRELLNDVYKLPGALLLPLDIDRLVSVTGHAVSV